MLFGISLAGPRSSWHRFEEKCAQKPDLQGAPPTCHKRLVDAVVVPDNKNTKMNSINEVVPTGECRDDEDGDSDGSV